MDFIDLIFISLPEFLSILMMICLFINRPINKVQIFYSTVIYLVICYFIKNNIQMGIHPILIYFAINLIIYKFSKAKFIHCFLATIGTMIIRIVLEWISVSVANAMGISLESILNDKLLKIFICNLCNIFMFIINYFILKIKLKKNNTRFKNIINYINKDIEYIVILVNIIIMIVISIGVVFVYSIQDTQYSKSYIIIGFFIFSLITLLITLIFFILLSNKKKVFTNLEKNLMERNLKQMEDSIDLLRMQRHDYMNHLQVILMQVSVGKIDDARKYILGLSNHETGDTIYYNTGNSYMDAILNTKKRRASRYNIELTACIDSLLEDVELSDSELSSVILNIVDNAIDELKKYDRDDKYIHVDIYRSDNEHSISVKNNGSKIQDIKKIFEMGYSSKGENRGYGLYSIRRLLESYNCTLEVYSDESETEFEIKVPIVF